MITSRPSFVVLWTTTLLTAVSFFQVATHAGAPKPPGRVISGPPSPPPDLNIESSPAATSRPTRQGRSNRQTEPVQLQQVQYAAECGPVCDCADCSVEAACGIEEYYVPGPVAGQAHGGIVDSGCGVEAACGFESGHGEATCGFEVGCGLGNAIDRLGPWFGRRCGVAGCTDCYGDVLDEACGAEQIVHGGPACGMDFEAACGLDGAPVDTFGACGCDACTSSNVDSIPIFFPLLRINWNRYDLFAGVQGFKGPLNFANTDGTNSGDRNGSGSFGFYEGFNQGRQLKGRWALGMSSQFGLRALQSNLSGAEFTDETRNQIFLTAGFFRRVDIGLQYGLVFDYLNEDWYFQSDIGQLRGELSWLNGDCHVYGFQFMAGVSDDTSTTSVRDGAGGVASSSLRFEPTDQYRLFYRRMLRHNGQWDAFVGWTDQDDGLLGTSLSLPVRPRLALATGVTYLIPSEGDQSGGNEEESWNLSLGLVFRPGGHNGAGRYARPLFDVADNGTFLIDRR